VTRGWNHSPRWEDNEVSLLHSNPDPLIVIRPSEAYQNESAPTRLPRQDTGTEPRLRGVTLESTPIDSPRTSKKPDPPRIYRISSSSCRCLRGQKGSMRAAIRLESSRASLRSRGTEIQLQPDKTGGKENEVELGDARTELSLEAEQWRVHPYTGTPVLADAAAHSLVEEHLDLGLVALPETFFRHGDLVALAKMTSAVIRAGSVACA
jgi:hypothetical protein